MVFIAQQIKEIIPEAVKIEKGVHIGKMSSIVWCDFKHACAGALPLEHTKCDQTPWL